MHICIFLQNIITIIIISDLQEGALRAGMGERKKIMMVGNAVFEDFILTSSYGIDIIFDG